MSKMKKVIIVITITIFGIILFATNPNKEQFKEHLKNEYENAAKEKGGLSSAFSGLTSELSVWAADNNINRGNYLLISSYSLNINNKDYIYIGALNHFIKLN